MTSLPSAMDTDELYPIAILIDELKNEDVQLRLNSIKRLSQIASALGPDRTRTELIPFLTESCTDDEDEVLLALSEELGELVNYIGGTERVACLIPPLETLCNVEDSNVRDKAVASLNKIAKQLKPEQVEAAFFPLLKRLSAGTYFTSRSSACALYATVYTNGSTDAKNFCLDTYKKLCKDDTPMVRRSAASHMGELVAVVDKESLKTKMVPMFQALKDDDQDSVRLITIENCVAFAKALPKEAVQHVLPTIKACAKDESWRVRYMVADHFKSLCEVLGPEITKTELLAAFVNLTKDGEAEVRTAASFKIADVCSLLSKDQINNDVLPCVQKLVTDKSEHVRAALASVIMNLAPALGKDDTIKFLLPMFLQLLKDEFPDVRLNIISRLDAVNKVIGIELLSQSLLPAIVELAEDSQWRVRLAIIEYIPLLAKQLGVKFFDEKLSDLCMTWLADSVYSIREAATNNLKKLTEIFGPEWSKSNLLPRVLAMHTNTNYLYRMTTLFAISTLSAVMKPEVISENMLGVTINLAKDRVPNIRFNVAKTLQVIIPRVDPQIVQEHIKPCLLALQDDDDPDVKFFATQSLSHC